jgi:hypothetical protein
MVVSKQYRDLGRVFGHSKGSRSLGESTHVFASLPPLTLDLNGKPTERRTSRLGNLPLGEREGREACGEKVETKPESKPGKARLDEAGNPPALGGESPVCETWGGHQHHADVLFQ